MRFLFVIALAATSAPALFGTLTSTANVFSTAYTQFFLGFGYDPGTQTFYAHAGSGDASTNNALESFTSVA